MHLLEGFRVALLNLDEVIQLIKSSQTVEAARGGLIARYELSALQANAILEMRLQKLTGMERLAIEKEHEELSKEIQRLMAILANPREVDSIITTELKTIRADYSDDRRTEILDSSESIDVEDLIEDEEMVVSVSRKGYLKRTALSTYRSQRRGGKGSTGASSKDEDFIEHLFVASTLSDVLVFTNLGRLYWMKVYEVPEAGRTARGRALINLVQVKSDETPTAILPIRKFDENRFVFMATKKGVVKKVGLMEFSRARKSGIIACTLDE